MKMEVLSKEKIKASSSTPQKIYLSKLDQTAPPAYVGLIFFYESPVIEPWDQSQVSQNLKHSLSQVLTSFQPLAGRINQKHSYIDCNNDGVVYVEARVHSEMSEAMENPDLTQLHKYVPLSEADKPEEIPLCIQVNFFDCGGIAVGVCISHKIADTKSLVNFMTSWSAVCRHVNLEQAEQPSFDLSSHFPPLDLSGAEQPPAETVTSENMVTKRFVFDKEMLLALKKIGTSSEVPNPSKMEALTAFLWGNFMASDISDDRKTRTTFAAMHAVNVRSRASPPLPEGSFGNACMQAFAWSKSSEEDRGQAALVSKLRNAIRKIDSDHVRKTINGEDDHGGFDGFSGEGLLEVCIFSSWCRFPIYEVDLGWGRPYWVSTYPVLHKNLTVFIDTKTGDGIEAWVTMDELDLAMIEKNYTHLLSNATALEIS